MGGKGTEREGRGGIRDKGGGGKVEGRLGWGRGKRRRKEKK